MFMDNDSIDIIRRYLSGIDKNHVIKGGLAAHSTMELFRMDLKKIIDCDMLLSNDISKKDLQRKKAFTEVNSIPHVRGVFPNLDRRTATQGRLTHAHRNHRGRSYLIGCSGMACLSPVSSR